MKQGTAINRIVILLFSAAIVIYFAGAVWRGLRDPYPTTTAYTQTVDDTVEATGYLVRTEQVLTGTGGIVRVIPSEGEKVAAGATIALLYADEASLTREQRLETLREQAQELSDALASSDQDHTATSGDLADALAALRSSVEGGDLTRLEEQTAALKSVVYRRSQTNSGAQDLTAALDALQQEIATLQSQSSQSTGRVTTPAGGIFSGLADGYESVLTPDVLETLTPSALDTLEGQASPVPESSLGKLITDPTWYFVCPLTEEEASRLTEGQALTVRFSRDWSGTVDMTVERIGAPENGRLAVIFSSNKFLSNITLLRRQTVELVFSQYTGIQVPASAVRIDEEGVTGVYVQVGTKAEFKPVTVLAQGEDSYLVTPLLPDDATDSQEKRVLRAGDPVIVATQEIYDGMVLQ